MIYTPVLRGFTEIEHIFNIAEETGSKICGGYPRYMSSPTLKPIPAGDVDIFPGNEEAFKKVEALVKQLEYTVKHENDVSMTFANPEKGRFAYSPTVQVIKPMREGSIVTERTYEEILENFDFTVVRVALVSKNLCIADDNFLVDEYKHKLVIRNIHCPISSLLRANKYARKGYYLPPSEALKLFTNWDGRTQEYRDRLIELFSISENSTEEKEMSQKEVDELEKLLRID